METTLLRIVLFIPIFAALFLALDVAAQWLGIPLPLVVIAVWATSGLLWFVIAAYWKRSIRFGIKEVVLAVFAMAVLLTMLSWCMTPLPSDHRTIALLKRINGRFKTEVTESPLLRRYFGDDNVLHVTEARPLNQLTDADMPLLHDLPKLKKLTLAGSQVTDDGLRYLKNLPELTYLNLAGMPISDAGLKHLKQVPSVEALWLDGTKITDDGLAQLLSLLPNLRSLSLNNTEITDEGLKTLAKYKNVRHLELFHCQITCDGLNNFKNMRRLRLEVDSQLLATACPACGHQNSVMLMNGYNRYVNPCQNCGFITKQQPL